MFGLPCCIESWSELGRQDLVGVGGSGMARRSSCGGEVEAQYGGMMDVVVEKKRVERGRV